MYILTTLKSWVAALFLTAAFMTVSGDAFAERRVALVIGNAGYTHTIPLANPVRDAKAMAQKLRALGFETIEGIDLDYNGFRRVQREFARAAYEADLAAIFYAGHGIAVDGTNYVIPIDAKLNHPVDWEYEVFELKELMSGLQGANGPGIVFVDACRDNPLREVLAQKVGATRSVGTRGLERLNVPSEGAGMAVAFATAPGQVAQDGTGINSPFTSALLNNIGAANLDFSAVMSQVTAEVFESTGQKQRVWVETTLTRPVILNSVEVAAVDPQNTLSDAPSVAASVPVAAAPNTVSADTALEVEKLIFQAALDSKDLADYQSYLDVYPNGRFAQIARNAVERLSAQEEQAVQPAPARTEVAALSPAQVAAPSPAATLTRSLSGPLQLTATDVLRQAPSSEVTEKELGLSRNQIRGLQTRLNLSGFDVGGADGRPGPRTRAGVRAWQQANGLPQSGFFNQGQVELLMANTEETYVTHLASTPTVSQPSAGTSRKSTAKSSSKRTYKKTTARRTTTRKSSNGGDQFGAFVAGALMGGAVGAIIGRR